MMITTCLLLLLAACVLFEGLYTLQQARIINGNYMEIEKAPWQVSIQIYDTHICGGSIYSDRIIISAAHCFYIKDSAHKKQRLLDDREILIVAGSEFKRSRETLAAVSAKIIHNDYNSTKCKCDLAIMKLLNPLPISNKLRPIPLAVKDPAPGSVVLATGWGTTQYPKIGVDPEIVPEVLQGLKLNIIDETSCDIGFDRFCVKAAGKSVCFGDSGGPLVFEKTLVGVASSVTSYTCSDSGVYSSVAYYRKWILDAIKSISKK